MFSVTGASLDGAYRATRNINDRWALRLTPDGLGSVTITSKDSPPCTDADAICCAGGVRLQGGTSHTVPGPTAIDMVDAEVEEEPGGAVLTFEITLSRPRLQLLTGVNYVTESVTATEGGRCRNDGSDTHDYRRKSGWVVFRFLLGTSFDSSGGGAAGAPGWSAWGWVASGGFDAVEDGVRMSGSVTSAFLGADVANGRWLAGLALSLSEGDYGDEETGSGGDMESTLGAFYPYARVSLDERLDVWGVLGYGTGALTLTHGHRGDGVQVETDRPDIAMRNRNAVLGGGRHAAIDGALLADLLRGHQVAVLDPDGLEDPAGRLQPLPALRHRGRARSMRRSVASSPFGARST